MQMNRKTITEYGTMVVVTDFQIEPMFPLSWRAVLVYAGKSPHQVMNKLLHTFLGPSLYSKQETKQYTDHQPLCPPSDPRLIASFSKEC